MNKTFDELNQVQREIARVGKRMKSSQTETPSAEWAVACKQNLDEMRELLDRLSLLIDQVMCGKEAKP